MEVEQEELESFLVVAEELAVKGLATDGKTREKKKDRSSERKEAVAVNDIRDEEMSKEIGDKSEVKTESQIENLKREMTRQSQNCDGGAVRPPDDGQWMNVKGGLNTDSKVFEDKVDADGKRDIPQALTLRKELHGYSCNLCGKQSPDLSKAKSHIEAKHFPSSTGYICKCCHQWFKTRNALSIHMSREHRNK